MSLDKNNNRTVVRQLSQRSIRTGGRTSLLTILIIALTAMLVTAMVLQTTGMVSSQKKLLERAQQVIYMNLTEGQRNTIESDERISSTIAYKIGQGVELHGILVQPSYYEPSTEDMNSLLLSEGRMAEAMNEIVIDKATLRAFCLPETLGTQITLSFLNNTPETFTVVGLTDYEADGGKVSKHLLYHSLAYAEKGPQLSKVSWYLMVRVKGGAEMNGYTLDSLIHQLGEEHGVSYQNINPNNLYLDLRTVNATNLMIYTAIAVALAVVSLIVIYSIFYLSVVGRVHQFGQLRTIGMTPKQLRRMVKLEGWLLWGIGTPVGFAVASTLMLIVGAENGWTLSNNLMALAASATVCGAAVRLGVQKPAKLAADTSPIEASRFQSWKGEKERTSNEPRVLSPFGLAKLTFCRNIKRQLLTILSLAVGGILFMTITIFMDGWDLEVYSRQGEFHDSEYLIYFNYNTENSLENGTSTMQLQRLFGDTFKAKLRKLPDVESFTEYHRVNIRFQWDGITDNDSLTPIERADSAGLQSCLQEGTGDYDALVESGGVYVAMSQQWKEIYGKVPQIGDEFVVSYYNGESHTVRLPVVGIGNNGTRDVYTASSMLLIPRETATALFGDMDTIQTLTVSMRDDSHTPEQDEQMRTFLEDYPQLQLSTITERMDDDASSYTVMKGLYISIGGFVIMFSLLNLLNTLLSGLIARQQQLAMLAAMGMTKRQIGSMLNYESLLLAGVNLTATLTLGTLAGWGVCQLMAALGADYLRFSFPSLWFLLYTAVAVGVPWMITQICLKSFYSKSLIERLRTTE